MKVGSATRSAKALVLTSKNPKQRRARGTLGAVFGIAPGVHRESIISLLRKHNDVAVYDPLPD